MRYPYYNRIKGIQGEGQVREWVSQVDHGLRGHKVEDQGIDILSEQYAVEVWNWKPGSYPTHERLMSIVKSLCEHPNKIKVLIFFQGELTSKEINYLRACGIRPILISQEPFSTMLKNPLLLKNVDVDTLYYHNNKLVFWGNAELIKLHLHPPFQRLATELWSLNMKFLSEGDGTLDPVKFCSHLRTQSRVSQ